MFDAIARLFKEPARHNLGNEPQLAVAALLVHLAAVDGSVTEAERAAVRAALMQHYGLAESDVETLIAEATRRDGDAVDFYQFTSALRGLEPAERVDVVRMMWQVVYADRHNHELEDNMVWRIAELLGVSSRERTTLRKQLARG